MACEYHIGFNSGSLVDLVTEESIKEVFEGDERDFAELEEKWVELGYGFCTPLNFENKNTEILYELDDELNADDYMNLGGMRDGEISISSQHPNFSKIINIIRGLNGSYYNEKAEQISAGQFDKLLELGTAVAEKQQAKKKAGALSKEGTKLVPEPFILTICELEPG